MSPALAQTAGQGNGPSNGGKASGHSNGVILEWQPGCSKGGGASASRGCGRSNPKKPVGEKPRKIVRVPLPNPKRVIVDLPDRNPVVTVAPAKPKKPKVVRKIVKPTGNAPVALAALPRPAAKPAAAPVLVGDFVADEVLVTLSGDAAMAEQIAGRFNLVVRSQRASTLLGRRIVRFGIPDGRAPEIVVAALGGADGVAAADLNAIYSLQAMRAPKNYAFERIGLQSGKSNGEGVAIAVIDSATDTRHPALKSAYAGFFDALPDFPVVDAAHGTAVGGLIAGGGNLPGMAPKARIFHARAFENGKSTMDAILAAFDWAVSQNARIVNMSFAGPQNGLMRSACEAALERGVVLVAAAGNNGPEAKPAYPGAYPGVIAVTATSERDTLMPQANRGDYVFVAAPGVDVVAPTPGGGADFMTGTSFAAAIASGAIANLIAADPTRDDNWVARTLSATARDLGAAGRDADFGYGLLTVGAAMAAAR
ncbi:MAG: S8 family serine peptidase [Phyllobacteriaceae bacterium]|nr:S8 family serine peptidase [Phyllobacteriaceae bacterium]